MYADEVGALLGSRHEGWRESARVVAGPRLLYLDDVGAEIGKHLHAGRPRKYAGEIEYLDVLQWSGRRSHPPPFADRMLNRKGTAEFESLARVPAMSNRFSAAMSGLEPAIHVCSTE